ncbi:MAG: hypothetical protein QNL91_02865 [Candidatus Krumholzibacteria bacterium]|nr:hypothetical protein [Candidatus Krumholzibacteria bacterium]
MKRIILVVLALTLMANGTALAVEKNGGLAASFAQPGGDFDKVIGSGFGLSAIFDYSMANVVDISGSLGWYRFGGKTLIEGTNVKSESLSVWEFSAGPQIDFGKLYMGVEGAYYTKLDEWGLVPNIGLRKDMIDVAFRYKMTEDSNFYALRLGFFF